MSQVTIEGKKREVAGKGAARKIRATGDIPGVLYGKNFEPLKFTTDEKTMNQAMTKLGLNPVIELKLDGESYTCMIAEYQKDIYQKYLTHIDLKRVSTDDKVTVSIPLRVDGETELRGRGGMVQVFLNQLRVRCLPLNIPMAHHVNVAKLKLGNSIRISDLSFPEGVECIEASTKRVVTVIAPRGSAGLTASDDEDEGEEGSAEG